MRRIRFACINPTFQAWRMHLEYKQETLRRVALGTFAFWKELAPQIRPVVPISLSAKRAKIKDALEAVTKEKEQQQNLNNVIPGGRTGGSAGVGAISISRRGARRHAISDSLSLMADLQLAGMIVEVAPLNVSSVMDTESGEIREGVEVGEVVHTSTGLEEGSSLEEGGEMAGTVSSADSRANTASSYADSNSNSRGSGGSRGRGDKKMSSLAVADAGRRKGKRM